MTPYATELPADRFATERIVLVGQSWGTILGVLGVRQQPALYSAFVGVGQMVSPVQDRPHLLPDTLAWARGAARRGW